MKANFNGVVTEYDDVSINPDNRGFRYGDGIFETIAVVKGKPRFLERHLQRIRKGTNLLMMKSVLTNPDTFSDQCHLLLLHNGTGVRYGKMRLYLWRNTSGLYKPDGDASEFLMTFEQSSPESGIRQLQQVDYCESVFNFPGSYSSLKTISALKYVIAGLEMREKGLDEIIIRDHNGNISESLYSNVFIKTGDVYRTPPLSSGCVEGIMRGWILDAFRSERLPVEERPITATDLMEAKSIFLTNAMGIQHLINFKDKVLVTDRAVQNLIESVG